MNSKKITINNASHQLLRDSNKPPFDEVGAIHTKATTTLILSAFLLSCKSSTDPQSQSQAAPSSTPTWRLTSLEKRVNSDASQPYSEYSRNYHYDESGEILSIEQTEIDCDSSSEMICLLPKATYRQHIEFTNISASHWLEEVITFRPSTTTEEQWTQEPSSQAREYTKWGDEIYESITDNGHTTDASTINNNFHEYILNQDSFNSNPTNSIGKTPRDIITEMAINGQLDIRRSYNDAGYLTYRGIYSNSENQLISSTLIEYIDAVTFHKATHTFYLQDGFGELDPSGKMHYSFSSTDSETSIHTLESLSEQEYLLKIEHGPTGVASLRRTFEATYELSDCGPLTFARSQKSAARDLPICIQK